MASLDHLEVELLASILEYVDDEHPESTKSVALVNKHIYSTSRLVSYRRKTLHFNELTEINELATRWLRNPTALRGIRHIVISDDGRESEPADVEDLESWRMLVIFIEQAARLRTIIWKCRIHIPLFVLEALEKFHPALQLKVHNFSRPSYSGDSQHLAELALASSPLLVGIDAELYHNYLHYRHDLSEVALRRIIARSPNLQYVSVLVDLADKAGHRAVAKELRDPFYVGCSPNSSVRTLTLDGYPLSKATLEDWSNFVDLASLESIKCLRGGEPAVDYFAHALKVLPNLKHVSLNLRFNNSKAFRAAVRNYLSLCPILESLSLWSWRGRVKLGTILRHGPTLQMLQLHEREEGMLAEPPMTEVQVRSIREACPHLRDLTIDMRRESRKLTAEERNDKICAELALFGPQLERVQIYFDLGIASIWSGMYRRTPGEADSSSDDDEEEVEDAEMEAFPMDQDDSDASESDVGLHIQVPVTFKVIRPSKARHIKRYVEEMWHTIFRTRRAGPRALDVKFGEWEQKTGVGSGGPRHVRSLETGLKSFWTARPCVRDNMLEECIIERHTLNKRF